MILEKLEVTSEIRDSFQVGMAPKGDEKSPTLGNINISHASRGSRALATKQIVLT